ncbi:MAG: AraC family transcriptional regulator [Oscillospiraceae bacterium]|nr:AraC family transcriptional regulator [Oscillospiraceae bacterium]
MVNSKKELTHVDYGNSPVKLLQFTRSCNSRSFNIHWHDRVELLLIDEGEMHVTCDDVKYIAKKGDIVIINPRQLHNADAGNDGVKYRVIMFELSLMSDSSPGNNKNIDPLLQNRIRFVNLVRDEEIKKYIDYITEELERESDANSLFVKGYVYCILGVLFRNYVNNKYIYSSVSEKINDVIDYIQDNFDKPLSTASIADMFSYEESYFCRKFKSQIGLSPVEYIRILRLQKAKKLLKTSNQTVNEIATACGYESASYFIRCFRKHYDVSPTEFRRLQELE